MGDQVTRAKAEITGLEQLVTIFTISSSVSTNPSLPSHLGQLHTLPLRKKKELQDMVTDSTSFSNYTQLIRTLRDIIYREH